MIYNNFDLNSRQSRPKYHGLMAPQVIPVCSQQPQFINPLLTTARSVTSSAISQRSVSPIHHQFNIIHPPIMHGQPKQILETNSASVPLSQRVFSVEIQSTPSILQPFRNVLQPSKQTNIIRSCQNLNGIQPLCYPSTQILKTNQQSIPLPMQSMKILNLEQILIQRQIKNQENGDSIITGQSSSKIYFHNATRSQYPPNNAPFQQQISSNIGSQKVITVTNTGLRVSDNKQIMNRHTKSASCHSKITGNNQGRQQTESKRALQNDQSLLNEQSQQSQQQQKQKQQIQLNNPKTTTQTRRSSFSLCQSKGSNVEIQIKSVENDQESTQTQLHSCNEIIQNHGSRICQTEENVHKRDRNIKEKMPISERNLSNNQSEIIARMVDNDIQEIQEQYKVQIGKIRDDETFSTPDRQPSQNQDLAVSDTFLLLNKEKDEKVKQSKPHLTYNLTPVHFEDHHLSQNPQELKKLPFSSQISLTERKQSQRNKSPVHQIFSEKNLNEQQADTTHATSKDYSPHQTPQKLPKQQINYDETVCQVAEQYVNPSAISALPQNLNIIQRTPDRHTKTKLDTHKPKEQLPSQSKELSQEQTWSLDKLEKEAENIKNSMSPELYFTLKDIQGQDSNNRGQKLKVLQSDIEKRVEGALPSLKEKEVKGISQAIYDSVFHLLRKKYSINVSKQTGELGGNNKKQEHLETRSSKNEKLIEKLSKGKFKDARDEMKRNKARSLSTQGVFQASKFCLSPIQEMESFAEQLQASKFTTEKKTKNEEDKGENNNNNRQIKAISSWEDNIKQIKYQVEATQQQVLAQKISSKMAEFIEQPTIELSVDNNNCIIKAISPKLLSNYHLPIFSEQKRSSTPLLEAAKSTSFFGQISCITTNNQNNSNQNLFSECNIPDSSYPDILLPSSAKLNLQFNSLNSSPNQFKNQKQESQQQNYKNFKNTILSTPKSQQISSINQKKTQLQVANAKENYTKEYLRKCSKEKKKKEENDYQRIKSTLMANFQKAQLGHLKELQQTMKEIQQRKASLSEHAQS